MPSETAPAHCSKISRASPTAGRDAKPTQRDRRVEPPIAKPRITSDKGFGLSLLDEVRIRASFGSRCEIIPAALLNRSNPGMMRVDRFDVRDRVSFTREHQHRRF